MTTTTRQRILDEATRQLLAHGSSEFTIAGVRDALRLSSGSMFHAFPTKPALVGAVYVEGMRAYQAAAIAAITGALRPEAAVEAWIEAHLCWVGDHRPLARFLFATQADEVVEAAAAELADANAAFQTAIDDLLAAASAVGLMAELPRPVGHGLVMGAAQEYCRRWTRGDAVDHPRDLVGLHQRAALAAMRSTCSEE